MKLWYTVSLNTRKIMEDSLMYMQKLSVFREILSSMVTSLYQYFTVNKEVNVYYKAKVYVLSKFPMNL